MSAQQEIENEVYELLYNVSDPEVGINIVDLGMVYGVDVKPHGIFINITLTSVGCPLQDLIEEEIRNTLATSEKIGSNPVWLNWVFEPRWVPAMMTDEGKDQFVAIGGYLPTY